MSRKGPCPSTLPAEVLSRKCGVAIASPPAPIAPVSTNVSRYANFLSFSFREPVVETVRIGERPIMRAGPPPL